MNKRRSPRKASRRKCGDCTLCCRLFEIATLDKLAGEECDRCAPGTGCTAYQRRPQECREFRCLWLDHPEWPDEARPDRSGFIFVERLAETVIGIPDPERPGRHDAEPVAGIIRDARASGRWVVIRAKPNPIYLPPTHNILELI